MIIHQRIGHVSTTDLTGKDIDFLDLEWFEIPKRIQRKKTRSGTDIAIKFLKEGQQLHEGDILYADTQKAIVVNVVETKAIVIEPSTMLEMGTVCYEIGNKHIPLFIQDNKVLLPFEKPMLRWLEASGYRPKIEVVKLLNLLRSNVAPHGHGGIGSTLFTKILKMASNES